MDDAALALLRFASGAIGSLEGTRFAPGRKNANRFEINGARGSLAFDLERLNELELYEEDGPQSGFRHVLATDPSNPYVEAWWPEEVLSPAELESRVQMGRREDKRVAVHLTISGEFGVLQTRDHAEYTPLFGDSQVGLETDQVIKRARQVILAKLEQGVWAPAGARVG